MRTGSSLPSRVVGAWKWLARYDFGVAVEMRASEAYAPLGYLEIALAVLMALIAIAIAVVVLEWMAIAGLRQRGVMGVVFVLFVIFLPDGLTGLIRRAWQRVSRPRP